MHLLLLPGMDGTGRLFEPLLRCLSPLLVPVVVAYPADRACGYAELLPLVEAVVPDGRDFLVLGESFSGPLALLLADRQSPGLRGVILCASFARTPLPSFARWLRALVRPLLFRLTPRWLIRHRLLGRFATEALVGMLDAALADVRPEVLAARARAILAVDVGGPLQSCPVPILYLAAGEDRVVSRRSLAHIRRLQPGAEVATIASPHLLLQAVPEEAARVIQAFASRVAGRKETAGA
jgi:pimeloyl-[acyl-carrier protein] methyl ester esterase